jgi:hypothetical protein
MAEQNGDGMDHLRGVSQELGVDGGGQQIPMQFLTDGGRKTVPSFVFRATFL